MRRPRLVSIIQTPKWLSTAGVNYARTAKVKASTEYGRGMYPANKINDGIADLTNNESRWVGGSDIEDTWVEFTWKEPVTINACRIVTGRFYEGRLVDPVGSFKLQTFKNGRWVDIPKAGIGENTAFDIGVQFDDVTTNRLRLFINTPGFLAKVWELELYRLKN